MALTQFTTDISYIAALPDSPTPNGGFSKAQLKAEFDKAGNALKTFINETMIVEIEAELNAKASPSNYYNKNDLNSTVDGSSGADKIGVTSIDGLSGTTTQTILESVSKTLIDIAISVKNKGAKGDGTDDTINLQSAFDLGGIIYLPEGNYRITDRLLMVDNTTVIFHPKARLYMSSNPSGINMLNAYKKQNIIIYNANIDGIYGAGTSFPPIGTVEGQGVTLGFYGCKNIKVYGGKFTANGSGSGNIYFSKCKNVIVDGVYIEKSTNGICIDNYYGDDTGYGGSYSSNITIINNTVFDVSGRGIAIDLGTGNYEDVFVGNNTLNACAYACISINANGFTLDNNKGNCKRDNGISTVGTQQSLPTYYGVVSDLGHFSNGLIINNKFVDLYKCGISAIYPQKIKIDNNEFKFAVSYLNQWDSLTINIQDDLADPHYSMLFSYNVNALNGAKNIVVSNNYIENLRTMDDTHIEKSILITDSSNSDTIKQDTSVIIENNRFYLSKAKTVIEYFSTNQNKYGKFELNKNEINIVTLSGIGIQLQPLDTITLNSNKFNGFDINIVLTKATTILAENNIHKNFNKCYYFSVSNLAGQIVNFKVSDVIIGSPSAGNYVFAGAFNGGYIITNSDASDLKFIGTSINQLKSCAYPKNVVYRGASATPTAGYWNSGDVYLWATVNTTVGQICKTEGSIGTAVFSNYIPVS